MNARRLRIINELEAEGLVVKAFQTPYGIDRDKIIAKSKIVLNMHYYDDPGLFESFRVSYLLANGACVVSEIGRGQKDYEEAVHVARYDDLVAQCVKLVHDDVKRKEMEIHGHLFMKENLDVAKLLESALVKLEKVEVSSSKRPTLSLIVIGANTEAFSRMDFLETAVHESDELLLIRHKMEDSEGRGIFLIAYWIQHNAM